jgi:hypothetical protein
MEQEPALRLLGSLLRYSLLDFNENAGRYELHDLLAEYALEQMGAQDEEAARLLHATYYKNLLAAADDLFLQGDEHILEGLALFDAEWFHIQAGQAWASSRMSDDTEAASLCIAYPDAGVYCLDLRLHPRKRIGWLETAAKAARETGGGKGMRSATWGMPTPTWGRCTICTRPSSSMSSSSSSRARLAGKGRNVPQVRNQRCASWN